MGVLPLKKDNDELRAIVERRPTLTELILRRPIEEGIDLDEYIGPRSGHWQRKPPDFDRE